ncbi:RNA-directed DNA polymerase, eukaryota, reverse transcriptase zinc-binding domain protein, partial [Tanacetum coccineum]
LHGYGVLLFKSLQFIVKLRRRYVVSSLMDTAYWLSEQQILDFFITHSSTLSCFDRDNLEIDVSLDEIKNAVWDCSSDKAPGPDGFTFAFMKKYWEDIKLDILKYVNTFFVSGSLPQGSNSSHPHPKVDFEKDFDSVSWKYSDFIILNLGIGSKWCTWIRACLNSARALVLVNGSATSEFSIKHELRQGDPLSHFLLILVMEGLHCALSNVVNSGLICGAKFDSPEITILHLFYADDVVITTEWSTNVLDNIIRVLQVFYLASGHRINIHKSNIYGIRVSDEDVFEQDVQEKPHDVGVKNKSLSILERTTQLLVKPKQSSIHFPNRVRKEKEEAQ